MIEKMESKKSDWARGTIKEVPFWREDMSVEEYEEERNYLNQHWTDYMNNRYAVLYFNTTSSADNPFSI